MSNREDLKQLSCLLTGLESALGVSGGGGGGAGLAGYDSSVGARLAEFERLSRQLGGDVAQMAGLALEAFEAMKSVVAEAASRQSRPSDSELQRLLEPLSQRLQRVDAARNAKRSSSQFNHLSAVAESIGALGWVAQPEKPAPFVESMRDAGVFYSNRVLKDAKSSPDGEVQTAWANAWTAVMAGLIAFVRERHLTGLTWGGGSGPASSASSSAEATMKSIMHRLEALTARFRSSGGISPARHQGDGGGGNVARTTALFSELNQGEGIAQRLQKPGTGRAGGGGGGAASKKSTEAAVGPAKTAATAASVSKPPVTELTGQKWSVEFHKNNRSIVIDKTSIKQAVYIYKCEDSTIRVKGKINGITMDSCRKCALVFDDLISAVDIVNCQSVQIQCLGSVPTVNVDKTDGVQVYLTEQCRSSCSIVTAKSSEMNVCTALANGDLNEFPLPEQFRNVWNGKGFTTEPTDSI